MIPITFDFETFWSTDFSLSKISFIEYINSPDFEVISVAVKVGDGPTKVVFSDDEVGAYLRSLDWSNAVAIAHNGNEFDFPVLLWHYGIKAAKYADTLCMARPKHQAEVGGSLALLSRAYGLPDKDNAILHSTKGKRYLDLQLDEMAAMARYNRGDVENTYALFKIFAKTTSAKEFALMDLTARMVLEARLQLDTDMLREALDKVQIGKATLLERVNEFLCVDDPKTILSSANKFAEALKLLGVEPPMKISKVTQQPTYAFSRTDDEFTALLEHANENVQALVAARLGVKSTILETRIQTLLRCHDAYPSALPVPLAYHAATTGRWGGRVYNCQNFPRINKKIPRPSDALRNSLVAPPGHAIVVSDSSAIELRVNHYLWGVASTQAAFAANADADLYKSFASEHLYNKHESLIDDTERQVAKVAQLGLGFGAGAKTFQRIAKTMGGVVLTLEEAEEVVRVWRAVYRDIVRGWKNCQTAVSALFHKASFSIDPRGLCVVNSMEGRVELPSGRFLYYPYLSRTMTDGELEYTYGRGRHASKLYSGLMCENLVQAIARDVIAEQALKIHQLTGYRPVLMVHDELVYVVPKGDAEEHLEHVLSVMRSAPNWLPGIIFWSKGNIGERYGDAK